MLYENHVHEDTHFPIIFHFDTTKSEFEESPFNWHESIEILYFVDGSSRVVSDTQSLITHPGDIVIINSNHLHSINAITQSSSYYCLIPDKSLCDECNIHVSELSFTPLITDSHLAAYMEQIISEACAAQPYYKAGIKAIVLSLLVYLTRFYSQEVDKNTASSPDQKISMVKQAICVMSEHFRENISTQDICKSVGFSKYYFCHNFKTVTNQTVLEYLNFIRCNNARQLLSTGKYTVNECAEQSGFQNASYFSKTYKKIFGISPSLSIGSATQSIKNEQLQF